MREIKERATSAKTAISCRIWLLLCVLLSLGWSGYCLDSNSVIHDDGNDIGTYNTDKFEIEIEDGVITYFKNKGTNTVYINGADSGSDVKSQALYAANATQIGFPMLQDINHADHRTHDFGTAARSQKTGTYKITWFFTSSQDSNITASTAVWLDETTEDLVIGQTISSDNTRNDTHRVRWAMTGIDNSLDIIVPYTGGIRVDGTDDIDTRKYFIWPYVWNAAFVVAQGTNEGFWVHTQDNHYTFKGLEVDFQQTDHALGFDTEVDAPFTSTNVLYSVHWRVNCYSGNSYQGSWSYPVHQYREYLVDSSYYQPGPRPSWTDDIKLILPNIVRNSSGPRIADELDDYIDPNTVLLGCAAWRQSTWPTNLPNMDMHSGWWQTDNDHWQEDHSFKTMIWLNMLQCTDDYDDYNDFYDPNYHVRNPMNSSQYWPTMFEGTSYMNLSWDGWRDEVIGNLGLEWTDFNNKPHGIKIDEGWTVTQDYGGTHDVGDMSQAHMDFHTELLAECNRPDGNAVLLGEEITEVSWRYQAFAQVHGYGGGWQDVNGVKRWTIPSSKHDELCPVFAVLFSPHTKPIGAWGLDGKDSYSEDANEAYEILRFSPMLGPTPQDSNGAYCILSENGGTEMTDIIQRQIDRATGDDGQEAPVLTYLRSAQDGNTSDSYEFCIKYEDDNDEGPGKTNSDGAYVRVVIDNILYELPRTASDYTNPVTFVKWIDGSEFGEGTHEYHFECWDSWTVVRYPTSGELTFDVNDTLY